MCSAVAADPNVDMLAWGSTPPSGQRVRDPGIDAQRAESTDKPVIGFVRMHSGRPAGGGVSGAGRLSVSAGPAGDRSRARRACVLRRAQGPPDRAAAAPTGTRRTAGRDLQAALASHGLPPPKSALAATPGEAARRAARIGFPVALKMPPRRSATRPRSAACGSISLGAGGRARSATRCGRGRAGRSGRADRRISGAGNGRGSRNDRRRAHRSALRPDDGRRRGRHSGRAGQGRGVPAPAGERATMPAP